MELVIFLESGSYVFFFLSSFLFTKSSGLVTVQFIFIQRKVEKLFQVHEGEKLRMIIKYSLIVFIHKRYYTTKIMEVLFAKQRDIDTKFKFASASLLYPTILSYKIAGKIVTGPKEIAAKWPKPKRAKSIWNSKIVRGKMIWFLSS